jgi:hypothetical protein
LTSQATMRAPLGPEEEPGNQAALGDDAAGTAEEEPGNQAALGDDAAGTAEEEPGNQAQRGGVANPLLDFPATWRVLRFAAAAP